MRGALTAIAVCVALAIAGCGGEDSSSTETTSAAATAPTLDRPLPVRSKPTVTVPKGPAPNRLVTKDLIVGKGPPAKQGDEVSIQYVGVLHDTGDTFAETSWTRDGPFVFALGDPEVTVGWNRGIEGMRLGGRRLVTIPPRLGFGNQQAGAAPPNSTLVYSIDLVDID